jgi:transposase-like protein
MRCDQCDATITGEPTRTATRTLCHGCGETLLGLTAGYASTGSVGGAISTARWYRVMRKIRRGGRG